MEKQSDVKAASQESAVTMDENDHGQALAEISFQKLWQRCLELARQGRHEDLRAMLMGHGVKRLTELPEEKYEEVFKELERW
jgi:uncharacterized protein with von Willebrand factor type A (vWA) domain